MKAQIITIGDEILIGQIIDTNSAFIAQMLNDLGVSIERIITIQDKKEEIISALDGALNEVDIVLFTGGLGPTSDDITKATLNEYFGGEIIFNQSVYDRLAVRFKDRPDILEANINQAHVPNNCKVMANNVGTASGMVFEKNGKYIISMPGVPSEMRYLMKEGVSPLIKNLNTQTAIEHKTYVVIGIPEVRLSNLLSKFEHELPANVKLAYLPNLNRVRLRLSAKGKDTELLLNLLNEQGSKIEKIVGSHIISDQDITPSQVIGNILIERNISLGLAESCTGGRLSGELTAIPGISKIYKGSVVAYHWDAKESLLGVSKQLLLSKGAVSTECVEAMAFGAQKVFSADIGVSISGIAGPGGGSKEKPVGLVYVGLAYKDKVMSKKLQFHGDRNRNIEMTINMVFQLIKKLIEEEY